MKQKMPLNELKALFPPPTPRFISPDGLEDHAELKHPGSKRLHRHIHSKAAKPKNGIISPAEYRRKHRGITKRK